jgi:hypothetical protein
LIENVPGQVRLTDCRHLEFEQPRHVSVSRLAAA